MGESEKSCRPECGEIERCLTRQDEQEGLLEAVQDYWKYRADTYSELNLEEMNGWKRDMWRRLILQYAPRRPFLKVLDIGTGPGFFAINMALAGFDVTAVDVTDEMLENAQANADAYGACVRFRQERAETLHLPDNTFDLILNRNVTWNLEYPERALMEWKRVLRPGGRMIYFDANWYRYLFDEKEAEKVRENSEETARRYPCYAKKVNEKYLFEQERMEKIAKNLPLSSEKRPMWDRRLLTEIGMEKIVIARNINDIIYTDEEKMRYRVFPMFMVCAQKPM